MEFEFDAFISYRRKDALLVAIWLRYKLTSHRMPIELTDGEQKPLSIYIDEVFSRATDAFYDNNIRLSLEKSKYLIVILSPAVFEPLSDGRPNWVQREIYDFLKINGIKNVIPVWAGGYRGDRVLDELSELGDQHQYINLNGLHWPRWPWGKEEDNLQKEVLKIVASLRNVFAPKMPLLLQEERSLRFQRFRRLAFAGLVAAFGLGGSMMWAVKSQLQKWEGMIEDYERQAQSAATDDKSEARLLHVAALAAAESGPFGTTLKDKIESIRWWIGLHYDHKIPMLLWHGRIPEAFSGYRDGQLVTVSSGQLRVWNTVTGELIGNPTPVFTESFVKIVPLAELSFLLTFVEYGTHLKVIDAAAGKTTSIPLFLESEVEITNQKIIVESDNNGRVIASRLSDDGLSLLKLAAHTNVVAFNSTTHHVIVSKHGQLVLGLLEKEKSYRKVLKIPCKLSVRSQVIPLVMFNFLDIEDGKSCHGIYDLYHDTWYPITSITGEGITIFNRNHLLVNEDSVSSVYELTTTGPSLKVTIGHGKTFSKPKLTPDMHYLVTFQHNIAQVWDVNSGDNVFTLPHNNSVYQAELSPDSKVLATITLDNRIHLWDLNSGTRLRSSYQHGDRINSIFFSSRGENLVSSSSDGTIRIEPLARVNDPSQLMTGHSPGLLVALGIAKTGFIWAVSQNGKLGVWKKNGQGGWSSLETEIVVAAEQSGFTVVGTREGVRTFQLRDIFLREICSTEKGAVISSVGISDDATLFLVGREDGRVRLFELSPKACRLLCDLPPVKDRINSVAIAPDKTRFALGSRSGTLQTWDIHGSDIGSRTCQQRQFERQFSGPIYKIGFSPDSRWLGVTGPPNLHIFGSNEAAAVSKLEFDRQGPWSLCFFKQHPTVGTVTLGGHAALVDLPSGRLNVPRIEGNSPLFSCDVSSDESLFITGNGKILDTTTGQEIWHIPANSTYVAMSPDGAFLVTADNYGSVSAWPLRKEVQLTTQLQLEAELATVATLDKRTGAPRPLTENEWKERRDALAQITE